MSKLPKKGGGGTINNGERGNNWILEQIFTNQQNTVISTIE